MNYLVSYNDKHNEAKGEGNRDGERNNRSWNCGVEGPTNIPDVNDLRQRQMLNLFATLLSSQGIPMICGGDEVARTQLGNNNAYCQDNESSSVNSSAKVFCVNAEYAEIERWIREEYARDHASDDVARMLKFNQLIKYASYMWNYVRLAPKFYKEFLVQMAKEFLAALDAG